MGFNIEVWLVNGSTVPEFLSPKANSRIACWAMNWGPPIQFWQLTVRDREGAGLDITIDPADADPTALRSEPGNQWARRTKIGLIGLEKSPLRPSRYGKP